MKSKIEQIIKKSLSKNLRSEIDEAIGNAVDELSLGEPLFSFCATKSGRVFIECDLGGPMVKNKSGALGYSINFKANLLDAIEFSMDGMSYETILTIRNAIVTAVKRMDKELKELQAE